jgi:hypothetical protein
MRRRIGTALALLLDGFGGIVATGWRVEPLPSRVGTRARVPRKAGAR